MLYVPAVVGAFNPDTLYCPVVLVVVLLIEIGEVAVNDIILALRTLDGDIVVSVSVPDALYVPRGSTEVGEIARVNKVLCLTVL